eukprot:TRINITY_DN8137_c0_g2_i10.p2 TRINITY_DN8137_c0_g2~~TRINITY_DN8137_c0_g2_i10.p2  ORF type:complete len:196 (+),score=39.14 TRINITY_DN8137_c0_g2_i10:149-736(+)
MFKTLVGLGATSASLYLGSKSCINTVNEQNLSAQRNAICILYPDGNSGVTGLVSFQQDNISAPTKIFANVRGLKPGSKHGFHIHEFGDLTEGCKTAGPHYNPDKKRHGGPSDQERHVGDLGNLQADDEGNARFSITDHLIKLFGEQTVVGRSCVVHADQDDLGRGNFEDSATTGHSGARVACGVIALSSEFKTVA